MADVALLFMYYWKCLLSAPWLDESMRYRGITLVPGTLKNAINIIAPINFNKFNLGAIKAIKNIDIIIRLVRDFVITMKNAKVPNILSHNHRFSLACPSFHNVKLINKNKNVPKVLGCPKVELRQLLQVIAAGSLEGMTSCNNPTLRGTKRLKNKNGITFCG